MKAVVRSRFGSPDVLEIRDVEKPEVTDDCALVRVRAASVNRAEWYGLTGRPLFARYEMGLFKPKIDRFGADFAGVVEAVGKNVTHVQPGDEVYGGRTGALAEYVCVKDAVVRKPANLTFEEAATIPIAGLTALQGLRDKGGVKPGHKVLVNGASGGVGTFAVQVAKALGAEVTAVCSTRNVELVRSLGADRVIDYTKGDFTLCGERFDVLFDGAGSKRFRACKRILKPGAVVVKAGAPMSGGLLGPLKHIITFRLASIRSGNPVVFFVAKFNRPDLDWFREQCEAGNIKPVVERVYPLEEIREAMRYMGTGSPQAKIAIAI